jgi:hypothetical protein
MSRIAAIVVIGMLVLAVLVLVLVPPAREAFVQLGSAVGTSSGSTGP